jgi:hypothetical protein
MPGLDDNDVFMTPEQEGAQSAILTFVLWIQTTKTPNYQVYCTNLRACGEHLIEFQKEYDRWIGILLGR